MLRYAALVALTCGCAWAQPGFTSTQVNENQNSYTYYNYKPVKKKVRPSSVTPSAPVLVEVPAARQGPHVIDSYPARPSPQEIQMGQALPPHPPGMPQYPMTYQVQQPYYFGPQPYFNQPVYSPGFFPGYRPGYCPAPGPRFSNNLTPQRFDPQPGEHPLSIQPMRPR